MIKKQLSRVILWCAIHSHADKFIPDSVYLRLLYRREFNKKLDLVNPRTFNEKLQWMKLHDRRPEYTMMVDKYAVKDYVSKIIGEEHIIPTLGIWDSTSDIDWDKLPEQFVLKCTHDSGGLVICRNISMLDKNAAIKKIEKAMKRDYWLAGREWPYKNVPRKIIAEQYMEDKGTGELRDYKFYCFNGNVKIMYISTERQRNNEPYVDFFDTNFHHLDVSQGHPNSPKIINKPDSFEKMIEIAKLLSKGLPYVRVDLYECNGKVYFGEMTFYPMSGMKPFCPYKWDAVIGEWLKI